MSGIAQFPRPWSCFFQIFLLQEMLTVDYTHIETRRDVPPPGTIGLTLQPETSLSMSS